MSEDTQAMPSTTSPISVPAEPPPSGMRVLAAMTPDQVRDGSPYKLAALVGKKVIHPGGRFSTRRVMAAAELGGARHILEVGCGVGHLAVKLARRVPKVTAIDIDPFMLSQTRARAAKAQLADRLDVVDASVEALPFQDGQFDRVIVESVTMFTDRDASLPEIARVLEPGGIVVDHEFMWGKPPSAWAAKTFARQFGDGACEIPDSWRQRYEAAGFEHVTVRTGPVLNFTPPGMVIDEGLGLFGMMGRLARRGVYLRRMASFMWDINRLIPWIRYGIITARRPRA